MRRRRAVYETKKDATTTVPIARRTGTCWLPYIPVYLLTKVGQIKNASNEPVEEAANSLTLAAPVQLQDIVLGGDHNPTLAFNYACYVRIT
jgi:hypothetical protein